MPRNAGKIYALKYNPADIKIIDLAAQTLEKDTQPGVIPFTGIEIISHSQGVLRFKADKDHHTDKVWTGPLTIIKIMPLTTGSTMIGFEQE